MWLHIFFYRTFINLLSDSSGDEDMFESEVQVPETAVTECERCVYMSTEIRMYLMIFREDLNPVKILKEHFNQYFDPTDIELAVTSLHVRRNHIWHDALRAISKPAFDPLLPVRVTFIGEPAVDDGGPRREFFSLALMKMSEDTTIFQGSPECRSFVHNMQGVQKRKFFYAGLFVGLSLANGGPGLACLAKTIYSSLCYGLQNGREFHEEEVPCDEIKGQLHEVRISYLCI